MLQMMGMLEGSGYEKTGAGSAASIHYVAETMRRFYADRNEYLGDPDFVKSPDQRAARSGLHSAAARLHRSGSRHAQRSSQSRPSQGQREHRDHAFLVVDAEGNAVAVTYTLNGGFGSGVTAPGLGFLLNNEMDDFASKPGEPNMFGLVQGETNAIQPGKRPLSSMTPTMRAARRQAVHGGGRARRIAHHHRGDCR